jgi:hypothetical protein
MYIFSHNLIFSCYSSVTYITGCGPPTIVANLLRYLATRIQNTNFLSVKLHPVQKIYNKFLYSICLEASLKYALAWRLWTTDTSSMPLLLSFTYISFQSLISSFYPEVNEVV